MMMDNLKRELTKYTPQQSKEIYKILREEWEFTQKYGKLKDRIHLGGYQ